jgi:hypothetical protein
VKVSLLERRRKEIPKSINISVWRGVQKRIMMSLGAKKCVIRSLLVSTLLATVFAFSPLSTTTTTTTTTTINRSGVPASFRTNNSANDCSGSRLFAGGFGGGGGGTKQKKKKVPKETKLKPKQQWDRYIAMKGEDRFQVAVRCKEDESDSWLEVGNVRSKGSEFTAVSVAKQRALIAEVIMIIC